METKRFDMTDTLGPQKELEDKIEAAADILRSGGRCL